MEYVNDITLTAFTGDPDELAMVYLKRGIEYAKLKEHKKAIEDFSNAIKYGSDEFKKNTFIFYLRGQEYTEIAEYKKSIDDFSESIRLNPAHIKSLLMRGNAYFGAGERDKTKTDFDEYLRRKKALKMKCNERNFLLYRYMIE